MGRSDFLSSVPPRFVVLRLAVPRAACFRSSRRPGTGPIRSAWRFAVRHPRASLRRGDDRISQVSGESLVDVPCSKTPARPRHPVISMPRYSLPRRIQRRPSRDAWFRGSVTRPAHSLCTLRSAGYPRPTQHSVPAGDQPLPGRVMLPAGLLYRFHDVAMSSFPPIRTSWRKTGERCESTGPGVAAAPMIVTALTGDRQRPRRLFGPGPGAALSGSSGQSCLG